MPALSTAPHHHHQLQRQLQLEAISFTYMESSAIVIGVRSEWMKRLQKESGSGGQSGRQTERKKSQAHDRCGVPSHRKLSSVV